MTTAQLHFQRGSASAQVLQQELDAILGELHGDPGATATITVAEGSHGADPVFTTIIITVTAHAATKLFDEIILPKLKDRFADDALGPPSSDIDE